MKIFTSTSCRENAKQRFVDFLMRIDEKEYLHQLQQGHIFMKRVCAYRTLNSQVPGIADVYEGMAKQEKVDNLTIKMSNGETLSLIPTGPVRHYYYGFSPIFCAYHFRLRYSYPCDEIILSFSEDVIHDLACNRKNPGVIFIDTKFFSERLKNYAESKKLFWKYGDVMYENTPENFCWSKDPIDAFFRKDLRYAHQEEWRFLLSNSKQTTELIPETETAYEFDVGDISSFAHIDDLNAITKPLPVKINNPI